MRQIRSSLKVAACSFVIVATAVTFAQPSGPLTRTFPFAPGERLQIHTARGHVEVRHATSNQVRVSIEIERGDLADYLDVSFEDTQEGLRIEGRKVGSAGWLSDWFSSSPEIRFVVEAPERLDLDVKTGGGHIDLSDLEGTVALSTSGGHITFARIAGPLTAKTSGGHIKGQSLSTSSTLHTSGGHITLEEAGQDLTVSTSGGHITLGEVKGKLSAETSGGHIKTRSAGGQVQAHTSGGHVTLALAEGNSDGADLSTSGGRIALQVPSGIGYQLDAEASGGSVDVDLPDLKVQNASRRDRVHGTIGRGGNLLRLRSSAGDIRISLSNGV